MFCTFLIILFLLLGIVTTINIITNKDKDKIIKSDTIVNTITLRDTLYKEGKVITHYSYIKQLDTLSLIDTITIINDFYTRYNIYIDTLKLNYKSLNGDIVIRDTLYQNQLLNRSYNYNLKYDEITVTNHVKTPIPAQFYIGSTVSFYKDIFSLSVDGYYSPRGNKNLIGIGVGFISVPTGVKPLFSIKYARGLKRN